MITEVEIVFNSTILYNSYKYIVQREVHKNILLFFCSVKICLRFQYNLLFYQDTNIYIRQYKTS